MLRRVEGQSMAPSLQHGDVIVVIKRSPKVDDMVLFRRGNREFIKRLQRIDHGKYYMVGDNRQESTDSRHYGFVSKTDILGIIMMILPKSVLPPKPVLSHGIWVGRIAAAILVIMALIHLFRIDMFIPIIDDIVPGGGGIAMFVSFLIILSEIFAIPFALRMRLSPLAHILSGALVVFAPLWWLLLTIWSFGIASTTGQLGKFVEVPANGWALLFNTMWVLLGYVTLYSLGYNRLKLASLIRSRR